MWDSVPQKEGEPPQWGTPFQSGQSPFTKHPQIVRFRLHALKKFLRVPRDAFSKTRTWQGCGTESHRRKERHNGLSIDRNEKKEYNPGGISRKKARKNEMAKAPLADRLRPKNLSEMVGQEHLFGKNGVIRRVLSKNHLTNMIFYGPPGTGAGRCVRCGVGAA